MHTPWGKSDYEKQIGDGITWYGTPSHGGFHVLAKRNQQMHPALRQDDGWYEEDCEYSKVMLAFPLYFSPKEIDDAQKTFRNWFPAEYEQFYNVVLKPGESFIRDQELFRTANAANWVGIAAFGDWQKGVPKGMVGVIATLGERRDPGVTKRFFIVPDAEYKFTGAGGFVIDLDRHQESAEFRQNVA